MRRAGIALAFAAALLASCAHSPAGTGSAAKRGVVSPTEFTPVDSATSALWRFDETGGTRLADAGPLRLDGRAGADTRTEFGRLRNARAFTRSIESFGYVPYRPALDAAAGFTVEAWVKVNAFGPYELTPIAGCWQPLASEQSWLFAITGEDIRPPAASLPSPGTFYPLVFQRAAGLVMFVYLPEEAGIPSAFFSTVPIEVNRWTHVAAAFDGEVVRIYIDGVLDSQFASRGRIRTSRAPLMMGNWFNWRWLTDFGGDLRVDNAPDRNSYYGFDGDIDELRLSRAARTEFPHARYRYERAPAKR